MQKKKDAEGFGAIVLNVRVGLNLLLQCKITPGNWESHIRTWHRAIQTQSFWLEGQKPHIRPDELGIAHETWYLVQSHDKPYGVEVLIRHIVQVCDEHRDRYVWKTSDWDECVMVESRPRKGLEEDKCGLDIISVGLQRRNISCVDATNSSIVMDDYICKRFMSIN